MAQYRVFAKNLAGTMTTERGYHHGDLRASLISRALAVVETDGYEAVSLRALAEELGVTRGAPYRHFPERDQLLAEVASLGFERAHALLGVEVEKAADPVEQLFRSGRLFLRFAGENPQLFRLMYDSGLLQRVDDFPHLAQVQRETYDAVYRLYAQAAGKTDAAKDKAMQARVVAFWATLFGYAKLLQADTLQPYMKGRIAAQELEDEVLRTAVGPEISAKLAGMHTVR